MEMPPNAQKNEKTSITKKNQSISRFLFFPRPGKKKETGTRTPAMMTMKNSSILEVAPGWKRKDRRHPADLQPPIYSLAEAPSRILSCPPKRGRIVE